MHSTNKNKVRNTAIVNEIKKYSKEIKRDMVEKIYQLCHQSKVTPPKSINVKITTPTPRTTTIYITIKD